MDSEALRSRTDCAGKLRILFCPQTDGGLVPARAAEEFADADEVVFIPSENVTGGERTSADIADFYLACRALDGKGPRLLMARNRLEAWEHVANSDIDGEIQDVKWREDELKAAKARFSASEFLSRRKAFPPGTYGSFFKNPEGDHAGRLLEEAGAKALRVG